MSKIGFYTGLCWSASFILAMFSLTQPAWGFAGNFLGILSIWVAGFQLRTLQTSSSADSHPWGVRKRWHKSLQAQLLAAILCTFVQYMYFRYVDNGRLLTALTEIYSNPLYADAMKQAVPGSDAKEMLALMSQISLTDLTLNFLVFNSFIAIVLSIPTALVAKVKVNTV